MGASTRKSAIDDAVVRYIAAWNETDAARRRLLVAQTWTERGSYRDPIVGGEGHDGIAAMIGSVQERLPFYRFRLISAEHHEIVLAHGYRPPTRAHVQPGDLIKLLWRDGRRPGAGRGAFSFWA